MTLLEHGCIIRSIDRIQLQLSSLPPLEVCTLSQTDSESSDRLFNMLFFHKWANEAIIELHPQCVQQFKRSYAKASRPQGNKTS